MLDAGRGFVRYLNSDFLKGLKMPAPVKDKIIEFLGKRYIHLTAACDILQISRPTGEKLVREGVLDACKVASLVYVPEESIEALLKTKYRVRARKKSK
jgi:hypothetical protein